MKHPILLLIPFVSLSVLPAQTSPAGLDSTEGNASFFASTNRRYQAIDSTQRGNTMVISQFALRRDGPSTHTPGASTVDVTLTMGETSMRAVYSEFDRNFAFNKTVVFPTASINWPDWSTPTSTPAPFDLVVPFNTTFLYIGQNDLVWDLVMENGTNTGNRFDRDYTSASNGSSASLSTGCSGFSITSTLQNNGATLPRFGMRLRTGVTNGPANAPVSLSLAASDANLNLPGFCATVHAVPLVILPLGSTDATGRIYDCYFSFSHDPSLVGFNLFSQAFSTAGGALSLSNGRRATMNASSATSGHAACYLWTPLSRVPNNSTAFFGGSIIAQLK